MKRGLGRWLIGLPPTAYLLIFFALPSLVMVLASFQYPGEFGGLSPMFSEDGALDLTLENYTRLAEGTLYLRLFAKSLLYALLTTFFCALLAYPLAMLIARSQARLRNILLLLVVLPFWSNFLVRIYAWMIILRPEGLLTKLLNAVLEPLGVEPVTLMFTPVAVVICLVYVHLPFMVLPLYANLEKHDPALLEAAQDLGAGPWRRFWRVTFPLSQPGLYAGAALVFIPAFGMFAVPDLVGGTDGIMLGNVVKQQFLEARDWPFGSVLAIAMTVVAVALAWVAARLGRPKGVAHG